MNGHDRRLARLVSFYPFNSRRELDAVKNACDRTVKRALINGELVRQPCVRCGMQRTVEAHHEDYDKPLEVIWLCRHHHRLRHAEIRTHIRGLLIDPPLTERLSAFKGMLTTDPAIALVRDATVLLVEELAAQELTELELARRLSRSRQYINLVIASGVRSLKALAVFADALGCDVNISLRRRVAKQQGVA